MTRAIVLVADSLGVGHSPDAEKFGDVGANTFHHIVQHMEAIGKPIQLPNLTQLGLFHISANANKLDYDHIKHVQPIAAHGYMAELSTGKDTPSGHWEMAGVPVLFDWGYFLDKTNSFPQTLIDKICKLGEVDGILANRHAPGTDVLTWFGEEHIRTLKPICYTSVDSVFQIAAHEEHFGLERLYKFCETVREALDDYNIGRVIARPFTGSGPEDFKRTGNRRDYSVLPPSPTILDNLTAAGGDVVSIGKIADIYAHQGITHKYKATGLEALIDTTIEQIETGPQAQTIIFTNLVNFDQDFGHRRDIEGYAQALEYFDSRIPDLIDALQEDDVLYLTADHGCDPSWPGTDHTREYVPIVAYGKKLHPINLGCRLTFADLGQTLSRQFNLQSMAYGQSFWDDMMTNHNAN